MGFADYADLRMNSSPNLICSFLDGIVLAVILTLSPFVGALGYKTVVIARRNDAAPSSFLFAFGWLHAIVNHDVLVSVPLSLSSSKSEP